MDRSTGIIKINNNVGVCVYIRIKIEAKNILKVKSYVNL